MKDLIVEQITITFVKALKKFAKKDKLENEDVSLLLSLREIEAVDEENNDADVKVLEYRVCHNHKVAYETKLQDIMGLTLTLTGIGSLVQAHIHAIIEQFEKDYKSDNIEVCVCLDRENDDSVSYFLFSNGVLAKEFLLVNVLKI